MWRLTKPQNKAGGVQGVGGWRGGGCSGRQSYRERERLWSSDGLSEHSLVLFPFIYTNKQWQTQSLDRHTHTQTHARVAKTPCHHILKPSKCACQKGSWLTAILSPPGGSRGEARLSQAKKKKKKTGTTKRIKTRQSDRRAFTQQLYVLKRTRVFRGPGSFRLASCLGAKAARKCAQVSHSEEKLMRQKNMK